MEIGLLLLKYAKLGYTQKRIKEIVLGTLLDSFSVVLEPADVEVHDDEVRIKVSGVRKAHLLLLKVPIETKLREQFEKEGITVSKIL